MGLNGPPLSMFEVISAAFFNWDSDMVDVNVARGQGGERLEADRWGGVLDLVGCGRSVVARG